MTFALIPLNNIVFLSVVEHVSKKQLTHKSEAMCATPVTGVNATPLNQRLPCHQMGRPPDCLGQITSVEENCIV